MVFKKTMYRLGQGENFHGEFDADSFKLFYLTNDASGVLVKCKVVKRRAGYLEVTTKDFEIEAKEVVPVGELLIASRGDGQVKMLSLSGLI